MLRSYQSVASGALIKDPIDHRTLYCAEFDRQVLCDALAVVRRFGYDPLACADTFAEGFDFYHARAEVDSPELVEYLRLNPACGRIRPELVTDPPPTGSPRPKPTTAWPRWSTGCSNSRPVSAGPTPWLCGGRPGWQGLPTETKSPRWKVPE